MKRIYSFSLFILICSMIMAACEGTQQNQEEQLVIEKNKDKKSGLELIVNMDKTQYELDEEIIAHIKIMNHNSVEKIVTVPNNSKQGAASVITQHQSEHWQGEYHLKVMNNKKSEQGIFDNISVYTIGPNETLEQDFTWDQQVMDQIDLSNKLLAPSGDYKLVAFLMVGEMIIKKGESIEETANRYQENPLNGLTVNMNYTISNGRDLLSLEEAKEIALKNDIAKQWFASRTYEHLVKQENGKMFRFPF